MLLICWILRTVPGVVFGVLPRPEHAQGGGKGDQEFPEQTVKIVRKRVARNFGGGGHLGVYPRLIP